VKIKPQLPPNKTPHQELEHTMNPEETAHNEMQKRLQDEEIKLKTELQRKHEEDLARLEMHKRLQNEEFEHRTRMQQNFIPQAQPVVIQNVINNNVNTSKPTLGSIVRLLYFIFFGFYIGFLWMGAAILICCTIIGIPVGVLMLAKSKEAFFLW
jgi:Inner membrane component domain